MGTYTCGHKGGDFDTKLAGLCADCAKQDRKDTPGGCAALLLFSGLFVACCGALLGIFLGMAKLVWGLF